MRSSSRTTLLVVAWTCIGTILPACGETPCTPGPPIQPVIFYGDFGEQFGTDDSHALSLKFYTGN